MVKPISIQLVISNETGSGKDIGGHPLLQKPQLIADNDVPISLGYNLHHLLYMRIVFLVKSEQTLHKYEQPGNINIPEKTCFSPSGMYVSMLLPIVSRLKKFGSFSRTLRRNKIRKDMATYARTVQHCSCLLKKKKFFASFQRQFQYFHCTHYLLNPMAMIALLPKHWQNPKTCILLHKFSYIFILIPFKLISTVSTKC